MLVTVSGPAGSGKSTLAGNLAEQFGYEHVSGGDIFREIAAERDLTPLELNKLAEDDEQIDLDLDRRLRSIAADRDDVVLESRLAGWMAGDHADLRIWLDAPISIRAERIADREEKSVETARAETEARSESEAQRYEEYYGINIADLSIYDLVLNTARWSVDGTLSVTTEAIDSLDNDDGKHPVTGVDYDFTV